MGGAYSTPTFLKWAGGKTRLLQEYDHLIPKEFDNYYEPFLGGGALFFYLRQKNPNGTKKFHISDINRELINTYRMVKSKPYKLIELLEKHKELHDSFGKAYYYNIRNMDSEELSNVEKAARFIYLNKTCYNGLYRVNSKGCFNVPIGRYNNPGIYDKNTIIKASKLLKNVKIEGKPYPKILDKTDDGSFVYLDPPYYSESSTANFTSYNETAFAKADQENLAEVFKELDRNGCSIMLSNSNHKFIRKLYKDYSPFTEIKAKRLINCIGGKRGPVSEILVRNY